jgi:hypothetical protein
MTQKDGEIIVQAVAVALRTALWGPFDAPVHRSA